jgi:two-component system response regulator DegU
VATAKDGTAALEAIQKFKPDVAVLDLEMPGLNGIEVTRESRKHLPTLAIVICSIHRNQQLIQAAADAGALGYVFKEDGFRDLVAAVDVVGRGTSFFPQKSDD